LWEDKKTFNSIRLIEDEEHKAPDKTHSTIIILRRADGSAVKVSRLRWPKSNLDRNLPSVASRGRCNSFQAAGTAIRLSKVSGHLSLPLWCQSRHPERDDDYGHLTPCRADFSIVLGARPIRKLVNPFGARWLTRGCARADTITGISSTCSRVMPWKCEFSCHYLRAEMLLKGWKIFFHHVSRRFVQSRLINCKRINYLFSKIVTYPLIYFRFI